MVAETGLSLRVIQVRICVFHDQMNTNSLPVQVWFQNKRSKERKGKPSKDDELGEDSQSSPPPTTSEPTPMAMES